MALEFQGLNVISFKKLSCILVQNTTEKSTKIPYAVIVFLANKNKKNPSQI